MELKKIMYTVALSGLLIGAMYFVILINVPIETQSPLCIYSDIYGGLNNHTSCKAELLRRLN